MKRRKILTVVFSLLCAATIMAQNVVNEKTGILLVHYGTSNDKSRAQTIDKLNSRVAETFPDCAMIVAAHNREKTTVSIFLRFMFI